MLLLPCVEWGVAVLYVFCVLKVTAWKGKNEGRVSVGVSVNFGVVGLLRFFSYLGLLGKSHDLWDSRKARFPVASVFLVCLVFLPFSKSSLVLKHRLHI